MLEKLRGGTWIERATVRSLTPIPAKGEYPPRIVVEIEGREHARFVNFDTPEQAQEWADEFAKRCNEDKRLAVIVREAC